MLSVDRQVLAGWTTKLAYEAERIGGSAREQTLSLAVIRGDIFGNSESEKSAPVFCGYINYFD